MREAVQIFCNDAYWRYTSADHEVTISGEIFEPLPLGRDAFTLSQNTMKSSLKIKVPRDFDLLYITGPKIVTVYRDELDDDDWLVYWKGRVSGIEFRGAEGEFNCESIFTSLKRAGLRAKYQFICRHVLYQGRCRAIASDYQVNTDVVSVSGLTVTTGISGYAASYFQGGLVQIGPNYRTITSHSGADVVLDRVIPGLAMGHTLMMWPGCNHTLSHCHSKFNQSLNFGGWPWIPNINPFSMTSSVF